MRVALIKLPGVESADVSLDKAAADIRLKADNTISVPQLRELMKRNGYPTRDARVIARGKISDRDGKTMIDLLNGVRMEIVADEKGTAQLEQLRRDTRQPILEVTGVSRAIAKNVEQLTMSSASVTQDR